MSSRYSAVEAVRRLDIMSFTILMVEMKSPAEKSKDVFARTQSWWLDIRWRVKFPHHKF